MICEQCDRPLRRRGQTVAEAPGTAKAHNAHLCRRCYDRGRVGSRKSAKEQAAVGRRRTRADVAREVEFLTGSDSEENLAGRLGYSTVKNMQIAVHRAPKRRVKVDVAAWIDFEGRGLPASPCKGDWDFHLLEARVEDAERRFRSRRGAKLTEIEYEAEARFCGDCPVKYECFQRAVEDGYTGIAGGVALIDGKDHRDKEEKVA